MTQRASPGPQQERPALPRLLGNLDHVLRHATGLPVSVADHALLCVALGTGRCLEEMKAFKHALHEAY